ncbi:MAG: hypothetical protein HYU67_12690 [Flavobacteriia bacterium]|nr:hypothetical protein [Flavobacteriia bacterium]
MTKKEQLKINQAISDLNSNSFDQIKQAISSIKSFGNESVLEPIFDKILEENIQSEIRKELIELLNSLKLESVQNEIIRLCSLKKYEVLKKEIFSTIWNSNQDYGKHLLFFVKNAIDEDLEITIECLTIIENMQDSINEKDLLETQILIRQFFDLNQNGNIQKKQILSIILENLNKLDSNIDDLR